MKIISGFLKFIAYVLMIIFVAFFPLCLFSRGVGQTLYDPADFLEMVNDEILDPEILANIVEDLIRENQEVQNSQGDNLFANVLLQGVLNLEHDEWVSMVNLIVPPEIVSQAFDQVLDSYYRWIDGRSPVPLFQISLVPWKNQIKTNTIPILELIMRDIRACNPEEIQIYNQIRLSGEYTNIPPCRPPEPNYSWILDTGAIEGPDFLETTLPNQIDNSKALSASTRDPVEFKDNYLNMVSVMQVGWIIAVGLFIIAIPLGTRSIPELFKWIGWPLLLAGVCGILISILLLFFTGSIMAVVGGLSSGTIPSTVFSQFELIGVSLVQYFQRPLLIQSVVIFGLGCISLIIGGIVGRTRTRISISEPQSDPLPDPPPAPTIRKKREKQEDDSSPTGMFG
ncbi:MAG: hypothetical protein PVF83_14175 [Anaerolineales bacterium]|jgi:hypothetical protein